MESNRKAKGRRYRVIRRRYRLQDPLWLWIGHRATHPKGDPTVFSKGDLLKVLKPGACFYYYHREAR